MINLLEVTWILYTNLSPSTNVLQVPTQSRRHKDEQDMIPIFEFMI